MKAPKMSEEKEKFYNDLLKQIPVEQISEFEKYSDLIVYYKDNYEVTDI